MDLRELNRNLERLHAQERSREILRKVEEVHPQLKAMPPDPSKGSIYRFAALANFREKEYLTGDVWWHLAMQEFKLTHCLKGVAILLVTPSFRSMDLIPTIDDIEAETQKALESVALMVSSGMEAIALAEAARQHSYGEEDVFPDHLVLRIVHEKHGYCLFRAARFQQAIEAYLKALKHTASEGSESTEPGLRAELKVRGGAALASYFLGAAENREQAQAEIEDIAQRSSQGDYLEGVHRISVRNLELMREKEVTDQNDLNHYDIS